MGNLVCVPTIDIEEFICALVLDEMTRFPESEFNSNDIYFNLCKNNTFRET